MTLSRFALPLAALAISALAFTAVADDREQVVNFKPGSTTARFRDTINGYDAINYYLDASAGQFLSIDLKKSKSTCYFIVHRPDNGGVIRDPQFRTNEFDARLDMSGRYRVIVYLMRVSARRGRSCTFTLDLELGTYLSYPLAFENRQRGAEFTA